MRDTSIGSKCLKLMIIGSILMLAIGPGKNETLIMSRILASSASSLNS